MQGYCFASLSLPSPIMCCHCEERSDEATFEITKTRFNVIQFEIHIISIGENLVLINLVKMCLFK